MNKTGVTFFYQSKILRWLLVITGVLLFLTAGGDFSCSLSSWRDRIGHPRHPRVMEPAKPRVIKRTIPLDPKRWSDWQNISPGKFFRIDSMGWWEIQFINGETRRFDKDEPVHLGKVKESIFRLRGESETATLHIEDLVD